MFGPCRKAWFKIFAKQNRNIFGFSHTFASLRFTIVQNKFWQTNKTKINHINDNHIKFEFVLHFWGIWPTVWHVPLFIFLLLEMIKQTSMSLITKIANIEIFSSLCKYFLWFINVHYLSLKDKWIRKMNSQTPYLNPNFFDTLIWICWHYIHFLFTSRHGVSSQLEHNNSFYWVLMKPRDQCQCWRNIFKSNWDYRISSYKALPRIIHAL